MNQNNGYMFQLEIANQNLNEKYIQNNFRQGVQIYFKND